jgi:hypothetical protein
MPDKLTAWLNDYGRTAIRQNTPGGATKFLNDVDAGQKTITPTAVFEALHRGLRLADYPPLPTDDPAIERKTATSTAEIESRPQNGWHYRLPRARHRLGWRTGGTPNARVSLNVRPEAALVEALDAFCAAHKAYYKTPDQLAGWQDRHDPITIYFHEPLTPAFEKELTAIATPYVRADKLEGRRIAQGIAAQQSPSPADIDALSAKATALAPELGQAVEAMALKIDTTSGQRRRSLSAGEKQAIEDALANYEATPEPAASASVPSDLAFAFSTYAGSTGAQQGCTITGDSMALTAFAHTLEVTYGLKAGEDFTNKTGDRLVIMGTAAQSALARLRAQTQPSAPPNAGAPRTNRSPQF